MPAFNACDALEMLALLKMPALWDCGLWNACALNACALENAPLERLRLGMPLRLELLGALELSAP
jgi:hypothetical protein